MQSGFASCDLLPGKENMKIFGGRDLGSQRAGRGLALPQSVPVWGWGVAGSHGHVTLVLEWCVTAWHLIPWARSCYPTGIPRHKAPAGECPSREGGCSVWEWRKLGQHCEGC